MMQKLGIGIENFKGITYFNTWMLPLVKFMQNVMLLAICCHLSQIYTTYCENNGVFPFSFNDRT